MAQRAITPATVPQTYAELRRDVQQVMLTGQQDIEWAWVRSYHETGRLIHSHILLQRRADYGATVYRRLARDTHASERKLYECTQFFRSFPILRRGAKFGWAHYRTFCQVDDPSQRAALMKLAAEQNWTSPQVIERVRALNAASDASNGDGASAKPAGRPNLLSPKRGTPGVYRITSVDGALVVDLGFACYLDLTADQAVTVQDGALVQLDGNGRIAAADGATKADLFNYRVEIIRVVDGDTFWVRIYLRPRQWLKQKLRLRGLDCPEISTPKGKAAKRFVDALVAKATSVTINTTKPDKYDRYLADVFLSTDSAVSAESPAKQGEIYLNNTLLENGHAVRKDEWRFRDWEPDLVG